MCREIEGGHYLAFKENKFRIEWTQREETVVVHSSQVVMAVQTKTTHCVRRGGSGGRGGGEVDGELFKNNVIVLVTCTRVDRVAQNIW